MFSPRYIAARAKEFCFWIPSTVEVDTQLSLITSHVKNFRLGFGKLKLDFSPEIDGGGAGSAADVEGTAAERRK